MVPGQHALDAHRNLTGNYTSILAYHLITVRQNWEHGAPFCLGESPEYKQFDLCYSFNTLVCLEYGGVRQLHDAVWNYRNNRVTALNHREDTRMSYKKALWNLVVFIFAHYIESFECHGARQDHRAILALKCLTVADELGRYHRWYKQADLRKPGIEKTHWKDLLSEPQEDCRSSYTLALATLGSPKQPSYGHPKLLGQYFDHVYHQSWNIEHLTWKAWFKATDYNETVYTRELNELLSHLWGIDDLNHTTRHKRVPTSLLNLEIVLPEAAFWAICGMNTSWVDKSWTCGGEMRGLYEHDQLKTQLDWNGDPKELIWTDDAVDWKDHEAMYLDDYLDEMPDLEETRSVDTSVYDRLGATPANTTVSTDTEVAGDMLNLSMGPPELPASRELNIKFGKPTTPADQSVQLCT